MKTLCLQALRRKDNEALRKISEFDTRVDIICCFTLNCVLCCLPQIVDCWFTKNNIFFPMSTGYLCIIMSTL